MVKRGSLPAGGISRKYPERAPICYCRAVKAPPTTWSSYREALHMFLRGATVPTADRIALVVGTWLTWMNHGDRIAAGEMPWVKVVLNCATPFTFTSATDCPRKSSNICSSEMRSYIGAL